MESSNWETGEKRKQDMLMGSEHLVLQRVDDLQALTECPKLSFGYDEFQLHELPDCGCACGIFSGDFLSYQWQDSLQAGFSCKSSLPRRLFKETF